MARVENPDPVSWRKLGLDWPHNDWENLGVTLDGNALLLVMVSLVWIRRGIYCVPLFFSSSTSSTGGAEGSDTDGDTFTRVCNGKKVVFVRGITPTARVTVPTDLIVNQQFACFD